MELLTSRSRVMVELSMFYFCFRNYLQLHFLLLGNLQMLFYQGLKMFLSLDGKNPSLVTLQFLMNERNLSSVVQMISNFLLPGSDLPTSQFEEVFDNFLTIWN